MDEIKATEPHIFKPRLEWVGRILGMDLYVDTGGLENVYSAIDKRKMAEALLWKAFNPRKDDDEKN